MEHLRGNPKSPTTYLGDLLAAVDSSVATPKLCGFGDLGVGSLLGELNAKELKQVWAGIAGAEEKAEYLSSHGVKDTAALEYAAAHGSKFTGSAEELSSPDVSWILSGSTIS